MIADDHNSESLSEDSGRRRASRHDGAGSSGRKEKSATAPPHSKQFRAKRNDKENVRTSTVGYRDLDTSQMRNNVPSTSSNPMGPPSAYTWVQVPHNETGRDLLDMLGKFSQDNLPANFRSPFVQFSTGGERAEEAEPTRADQSLPSGSSSIKEDSLRKRVSRASKRQADEDARKRQSAGLRPYVVEVRPSGIIDSGCAGHLKWQEQVRNFTPRMLDLSVIKYEDQSQSSRDKLRDQLFSKFEFVNNEVTQISFDKMIKTWLRRYRERVRRVHGGSVKPPGRYTDEQWASLRNYWTSTEYKEKSETMSERRKKQMYNPRVGRHGYAGKAANLVSTLHMYVWRDLRRGGCAG